MVNQISFSLVVFLLVFIFLCFILMLLIAPMAWRGYQQLNEISKNTKTIKLIRESISTHLERLSEAQDESEIHRLIETIRKEAKCTVRIQPQTKQGQQAVAVLQWLDNFVVKRHVSDLRNFGESAQIRYDAQKKDFKLMIVSQ